MSTIVFYLLIFMTSALVFLGYVYYKQLVTFNKFSTQLKQAIDREMNNYFTTMDFKYAVDRSVEAYIRQRSDEVIAQKSKEVINNCIDQSVEDRLSALSSEMAAKYTYESFEKHLKEKMFKRIGKDIATNLLGTNKQSDNYDY